MTTCTTATAQTTAPRPPALRSLSPNGVRTHVTEAAGTMGFAVTNPTDRDLELRILTSYAGAPERQYGRDVWVPAHATLSSWFAAGAPGPVSSRTGVGLRSLLYERDGGQEYLVPNPEGPALRESFARYARPEPVTAVMLDAELFDGTWQPAAADAARAEDVRNLARAFRELCGRSEQISWVHDRFLPPAAETFEGVDQFLLATDRLAADAAGLDAVRGWVQRGGRLWVMLDYVQPGTVAALLGDELGLHVVGRVGLTSIPIRNGPSNATRNDDAGLEVEEPVDFVRVLAPGRAPLHTVHRWPASFVVALGRGKVLFTALAARGWLRPRTPHDRPSPYPQFPQLAVARDSLQAIANEIGGDAERPVLAPDDAQAYLNGQIGYAVVGRGATLLVFGLFFLGLAVGVAALGPARLGEHLGWAGPALALGAAAVFVMLGERARSAVPPTAAYAQFVDAAAGVDEVQVSGRVAVYRADSGPAPAGAEHGGDFALDTQGLDGRVLRRVQTDLGRWHWENLELPAGVRTAAFRASTRTTEPLVARARFGPDGLEGRVTTGPFGSLEDALISTPGSGKLAVRVAADGGFRAGPADLLSPGQYVADGLLGDRQRERQALYAKAFADPPPRTLAERRLLLAWSAPLDPHFSFEPQTRLDGAALLAIPLEFERTPPDTPVTIPAPFLECRRVDELGNSRPPPTQMAEPVDLRLRFQLPGCVLPFHVERARLTVRLRAPARPVALGGYDGAAAVILRRVDSPTGAEVVEISDPRLLRPDESGGVFAHLAIGDVPRGSGRLPWKIETLELEVRGRTLGGS
jgi:hypothetical protein